MPYLADALQYQKDSEDFSTKIIENLRTITKDLVELVENKSIALFCYRNNTTAKYWNNAHPISISVDIKSKASKNPIEARNNTIILGYMDNFDNVKLNNEAKAILININEFLSTINENFVSELPAIDRMTFCSLSTLHNGVLMDGDVEIPLYPEEFSPDIIIQTKKLKIK